MRYTWPSEQRMGCIGSTFTSSGLGVVTLLQDGPYWFDCFVMTPTGVAGACLPAQGLCHKYLWPEQFLCKANQSLKSTDWASRCLRARARRILLSELAPRSAEVPIPWGLSYTRPSTAQKDPGNGRLVAPNPQNRWGLGPYFTQISKGPPE